MNLPDPTATSGSHRSAQQHLASLRQLYQAVPPSARPIVTTFWKAVRDNLNSLEREINELQTQLSRVTSTPTRPNTSASVNALRDAVEQAIVGTAQVAEDASETIEAICDLDIGWTIELLKRYRQRTNATDCWMSNLAPGHPNGYVKVNLRNSPVPGNPDEKIGVSPWLHQLAIIASGRGPTLRLTTGAEFHVSHLCHNGSCFNPAHVVVEESELNEKRKGCQGLYVMKLPDGTVIDPCVHWTVGWRLHCILPSRHIPQEARGKWVDLSPTDGPIIRGS